MRVGEICCRGVVTAERDETVLEAARSMRQQGVPEVVVIDREGGRRRPLGLLTDRGIVVELVARELDVARTAVAEVMERDLPLLHEEEWLLDAVATLRSTGRQRLPVVNGLGDLVGILSRDEVLEILGDQLVMLISLTGEVEKNPHLDQVAAADTSPAYRFPMD